MMNTRKSILSESRLAASVSVIALAGLFAPVMHAQEESAGEPASDRRLATVTVVAQKKEESIQDVPIAISAFGEEALERAQIEDATDLQLSIPNAVLVGNENLTIRGIGGGGVGAFINFAGIGQVPQNEFFDLERIEVLRGPQGTLYGRNTTGGAVNIITRKPDDEFGGDLRVQLGNFNTVRVGGALNLPVTDGFGQRFAGYIQKRDGFTENLFTGNDIDDRDQWALRSTTSFDLGNTQADLVLGYFEENSSRARETKRLCTADPVLGCSATSLGFDSPASQTTILQTLIGFTGVAPGGLIYAGAPNPADLRKVAADYDPTYDAEQFYGTLNLDHDFGSLVLTSVTGFNWNESTGTTDWDNSALPYRFTAPLTYSLNEDTVITTDQLRTTDSFAADNQTWSQELRLGSQFDGRFNYVAGLFYSDSKSSNAFRTWHPAIEYLQRALGRPPQTWFVNTETPESRQEAWAAFGEGYLELGPDTKLTVGARYTEEERSIRTRALVLTPLLPFTVAELEGDKWTGKIAVDHKAALPMTDETLLFASVSTGFKSGGLNPGSNVKPSFDEETVTAFELGAKNTLLDGSMRANLAGFYYDYAGLQLAQRINAAFLTSNADATVWGLEGEFTWAPADGWLLDSNVSYLNTEIGDFVTVDAANPAQSPTATAPEVFINLKGNELPHSPEFKIKVGGQYSWDIGREDWEATLRADAAWQSEYFSREFNIATDQIDAWGFLDFQAKLASAEKGWSVSAYVKNVTDEDNITNIIIEDALIGRYRNARILEPRTYGIILTKDF
jgi:iron complex outermembrane recepter protein